MYYPMDWEYQRSTALDWEFIFIAIQDVHTHIWNSQVIN